MWWLLWMVLASHVTRSPAEVAGALSTLERYASFVRQHPESSSAQALAAARLAARFSSSLDPELVRATQAMARSARRLNAPDTRDRAIDVGERARAARSPGTAPSPTGDE